MIPLLRSECRKLLSVRSTYVISGAALLLITFLAFYVEGFRGTNGYEGWLMSLISNVSTTISPFVAIIAILLMGYEYRYNTITYTLAAANSRTKVLLSKIAVVIGYTLALTLVSWLLAVGAYCLGASLSPIQGQTIVTPDLFWGDLWRNAYFVFGFGMLGLLLAFLVRQLVGTITILFIWPTFEMLLSPLLKQNAHYLPLSLLNQIHAGTDFGPSMPALLFLFYLVGTWVIAGYIFNRRDAN
jgi:ABC-2 type transport system permease protein